MALEYTNKYEYNGVLVYEHLLTQYAPGLSLPEKFTKKIIGVTVHNTDRVSTLPGYTQAEQYTLATQNNNMGTVRVHFYVDDICAWQNLPLDMRGWHAADGGGNGNSATIAIECIMDNTGLSTEYNSKARDNCARLAAYLLKYLGLTVEDGLFTHTYWLNKKDGFTGTKDYLNTKPNSYKTCPLYIIPNWYDFKAMVQSYYDGVDVTPIQRQDISKYFCYPIQNATVSSLNPKTYQGHDKEGHYSKIDIACPSGTSIYSMCDGEVTRWGLDSEGNSILQISSTDHGYYRYYKQQTLYFRYIHLKECEIQSGPVKKGQYIGKSGGAPGDYGKGTSKGAHLHVDISLSPEGAYFPLDNDLEDYCSNWDLYDKIFPGSQVSAQGRYPYMIFLNPPIAVVGDIVSGFNPSVSLNVDVNDIATKCCIGVIAYEVGTYNKDNPTFWGCTEGYTRCARNRVLGGADLKNTTLNWLGGNLSYPEQQMIESAEKLMQTFPEFVDYVVKVLNGYDFFDLETAIDKYGKYLQGFTNNDLYSLTGFGAGSRYFYKNYSVAQTIGSDNFSTVYFQKWEYMTGLDASKKPQL